MDKYLMFRNIVLDNPNANFINSIVLSLVNEIIRLKVEYEGLIIPEDAKEPAEQEKHCTNEIGECILKNFGECKDCPYYTTA
jgi:hypothetical protein